MCEASGVLVPGARPDLPSLDWTSFKDVALNCGRGGLARKNSGTASCLSTGLGCIGILLLERVLAAGLRCSSAARLRVAFPGDAIGTICRGPTAISSPTAILCVVVAWRLL